MSIDLNSGTGLFDRLGAIGHVLNILNTFRGSTGSGYPTKEINDVLAMFDGSSSATLRSAVKPDSLIAALTAARDGLGSLAQSLQSVAASTLIEMAHADTPLSRKSTSDALKLLRAQMLSGSQTVDASEPSSSVTYGSGNSGTGVVIATVLDGYGRRCENCLAEAITATCTTAVEAGSEILRFDGSANTAAGKLDYRFPSGSGRSRYVISSRAVGSVGLTNGSMEAQTGNIPDGWSLIVGAAGTDILTEASTVYVQTKATRFAGDGATLTQIRQQLNTTGLLTRSPYAINLFAKMSAAPAAGVLTVDLFDGTSVITDDEGTANSFTVDLTTLGTSWVAKNSVFRLPDPIPSMVYLRIRLSTALSASRSLYIDEVSFQKMQPLYSHGPSLAAVSGSVMWGIDDTATVTVANARTGAFQELFDRLFDTASLGFVLPSATGGAETIDDALLG